MDRRRFLTLTAATAALSGCGRWRGIALPIRVDRPGMVEGHLLRDAAALPAPSANVTTGTVILGGGVAGLGCAYKLAREGDGDFLVVTGPEPMGNAACGRFGEWRYPKGAHYLPLPSRESTHVRELLYDLGVIESGPFSEKPHFDEAALVHSPDERLFADGVWHDSLMPEPLDADTRRFFGLAEKLKRRIGADGKKLFAIPVSLSSADAEWRRLDAQTFASWLAEHGYRSAKLLWYLDYACRDDYGAGIDVVSAWAGLHYFASRAGEAANAGAGAVLTWSAGLGEITGRMQDRVAAQRRDGFAVSLKETAAGVEALCAARTAGGWKTYTVHARRAVVAMPLHVARRVVKFTDYGVDISIPLPPQASWLVGNLHMEGFPAEARGAPLAWDNVVHRGRTLGYVDASHQAVRAARPATTVFTSYQALSGQTPADLRRFLATAGADALAELLLADLETVYGWRLYRHAKALDVTVRGHAMSTPVPGYLDHPTLLALRGLDQKVLFAHGDLSGYSVFEEALWWGYRAAARILDR
ncbi:NAD(P)/FAD-dependent oxidoreductase [Crenobacter cavernae]|uniref:Amine oxidase n=1 Tax=Crenobacter cavernae TaxID=2290923 RepID=A0A345Y946_9NEIS|nr:NAD(P)/FAD-dependent oxidoreductase [Crenobacter cavernae]AXK40448.1 hypothetical protein DWG20_13970 [Crenobacter cavernae]